MPDHGRSGAWLLPASPALTPFRRSEWDALNIRTGLSAALLSNLLLVTPASADDLPVALVMKVNGETTPKLTARTEITAREKITLAPETELTFLHYNKCQVVTVAGGSLTLGSDDYATDGRIERQQKGPCPKVYQVAGSTGGWVSRDPPRLSVDPEIIFVGPRADKVADAVLYVKAQPDHPLFHLQFADGGAIKPAGAPLLTANQRYVLRVTTNDRSEPVEQDVVATEKGSLVVLRLE